MKAIFFLLMTMTVAVTVLQAQDSLVYRPHFLNTRILTTQGQMRNGYIYAVSDSALLFSLVKRRPNLYDTAATDSLQRFGYRDLNWVTIHSPGGVGRSVLTGLVVGAATGALIGVFSGDDPPGWFSFTAGQKAAILGTLGGFVGTLTGLIIGVASHRVFVIKGRKENLNRMSHKLAIRMGMS